MKRLFTDEGQALVKVGRLRDAEQLYVAAQLIDLAVEMYRSSKNYDQLIRLITNHQPNQLSHYHLDIARQLQADGNRKSAEKHFIAVYYSVSTCRIFKETFSNEKSFFTIGQ